MAVMAVFAGNDVIPGATPEDAAELKSLLEVDERVKDHMVKVFPGQDHGFAHIGLSQEQTQMDDSERYLEDEFGGSGKLDFGRGDAQVACLLSTAFMETYSRVFLPTVGPPVSMESEWGKMIEMKDLSKADQRNVRQELKEAEENFVEEPLGGHYIDPSDESQDEELARILRAYQDPNMKDGPNKILPDDDLSTIYSKLIASDENFQIW